MVNIIALKMATHSVDPDSMRIESWSSVDRPLGARAVVDNIRRRIVGVMFPPSIFEDR